MRGIDEFLQETHTCQDVTSHKIQFASIAEEGPCANCTHGTCEDSYGVPPTSIKGRPEHRENRGSDYKIGSGTLFCTH